MEAKREMTGNYNAMQLLLDNLKRRENWPEEFIRALQECEHPELAQEMRDAYEALKSTASKYTHTHTHRNMKKHAHKIHIHKDINTLTKIILKNHRNICNVRRITLNNFT